jgi:hypothetical protein
MKTAKFKTEKQKLAFGAKLKAGDIVQDCRYKEMAIKSITPFSANGVLVDYDITLKDGASCSWMHCCDLPGSPTPTNPCEKRIGIPIRRQRSRR